jgi:uncharacterized protein YjiS (DUF1127 family)
MTATAHAPLTFPHPLPRPYRAGRTAPGLLARVTATLRLWRQRSQGRHALMELDYRDLRDIGITSVDAQWEASQPFWRESARR